MGNKKIDSYGMFVDMLPSPLLNISALNPSILLKNLFFFFRMFLLGVFVNYDASKMFLDLRCFHSLEKHFRYSYSTYWTHTLGAKTDCFYQNQPTGQQSIDLHHFLPEYMKRQKISSGPMTL